MSNHGLTIENMDLSRFHLAVLCVQKKIPGRFTCFGNRGLQTSN
jgi:hypothetical protein